MPFKSKAQRRKFAELLVKGEISPETYEEWNRETGRQELPERVHRAKKKRKPKAAKRTSTTTRATKRMAKKRATKKRTAKKRTAKRR